MPRILLVEDDILTRLVISDALQDSGFQVHEAANAMEAIEILRDDGFDLVLTDVRMPGAVDGLGLLEWVRRNRPRLPVIVTSAYTMNAETMLRPDRPERFIPKPADPFQIASR